MRICRPKRARSSDFAIALTSRNVMGRSRASTSQLLRDRSLSLTCPRLEPPASESPVCRVSTPSGDGRCLPSGKGSATGGTASESAPPVTDQWRPWARQPIAPKVTANTPASKSSQSGKPTYRATITAATTLTTTTAAAINVRRNTTGAVPCLGNSGPLTPQSSHHSGPG